METEVFLNFLSGVLDFFAYGIRQSWTDWTESFAPVSGRNDLRLEAMAALGARRGRSPAVCQTGAGIRHQLFRYGRYVFAREERRGPWPRSQRLCLRPGSCRCRNEGVHAD